MTVKSKHLEIKVSKNANQLSKEQKRFNRLSKQIENLNIKIDKDRNHYDTLISSYNETVLPNLKQIGILQQDIVEILHRSRTKYKYGVKQREDLDYIIRLLIEKTIDEIEMPRDTIREMYEQYFGQSYDELEEEEAGHMNSYMKLEVAHMIKEMLGIDVDIDDMPDFDENNPQAVLDFIEQLGNKTEPSNEAPKEKPKKTKKQLKREIQEEEENKQKLKSIRSVYISLAKILHPDTATNEVERLEKEELMKRVALAYDEKDLVTLLRLESEWIDQTTEHLQDLKKDQILLYCQALKEQIEELKMEHRSLYHNPRYESIIPLMLLSPGKAKKELRLLAKGYIDQVKLMNDDRGSLTNKKGILEFVRAVKAVSSSDEADELLDFLFDWDGEEDFV